MKGLILSGGTGSRMMPLTIQYPKQLLPINNKPILYYIIEMFKEASINEIIVIVGDTYPAIQKTLGNGNRWSVKIQYQFQPFPLGLAHAVQISQKLLGDEDFVMALGDNFLDIDLGSVIQSHYESNNDATLILKEVDEPERFGIAYIENEKIIKVVEKPQYSTSNLAVLGLYVFNNHKIFQGIREIKPSKRNELEITDAIQQLLLKGNQIGFFQHQNPWLDIGTPRDLYQVNIQLLKGLKGHIAGEVDEKSVVNKAVTIGKGTRIINSIIEGPASIAEDTLIVNSHIGKNAVIGKNCSIYNSQLEQCILLDDTHILNQEKPLCSYILGANSLIRIN